MAKIDDIQDELWQLKTELQHKQGFEVPTDYFDQLPDMVLAKIKTQSETVTDIELSPRNNWLDALLERLVLLLQPRYVMVTTAVGLLLLAFVFLLPSTTAPSKSIALEELQQEEVVRYIQNNLEEFEEEILLFEMEEEVDH